MKKKMQKMVSFCDGCGKEDEYLYVCLECGVEHCCSCVDKLGKKYNHGIHVSGSGDGYYCKKCDSKLSMTQNCDLHNAYIDIVDLQSEQERWYSDFKERVDAVEKKIEELVFPK